ncbi:serine hydrolase domain-containing protein [Burkholderia gladioli]|uniref:serine hydrolase domain-containing protein n=1 Tax=Burkholderia gladioli TaxID=28095 RepID=UPI0037099202
MTAASLDPTAFSLDAASLAARLDAVFDQALRERRLVGAVAIVARHGEILYRRAQGLADREAGRPMREDTLFRLASVTKPIVALAVLRLVARGELALDAPVTRWLPEFRPRLADGSEPLVTIHHLLTHTSGLGYWLLEGAGSVYDRLGISDGIDLRDFDLDENLRRLASAPLSFAPGSGWQYSLALDVLGAVVERATGQPLAGAVDALVAQPLGMRDCGFVSAEPSASPCLTTTASRSRCACATASRCRCRKATARPCVSRPRACSSRAPIPRAAPACTARPTMSCARSRRSAPIPVSCPRRWPTRRAATRPESAPRRAAPAGASAT